LFSVEKWNFNAAFTEHRGHAIEIVRDAIRDGCERVIAVGGDGLVNETVNGLLAAQNPVTQLGIIPCGTGNDLARMLGLPRETFAAAQHLARSKQTRVIDAAEVTCAINGQPQRRYFANDANLGFAAQVVERLERTGKFSRGTVPYFTALLRTALRHRNHELTLQWNGQTATESLTTVLICNGQTTGGGMRVAPGAVLDDGALDLIVIGSLLPWQILWHAPKIYRGTHVAIRKVSVHRVQSLSVNSRDALSVVADGELIGQTPARFRVLPQALRVCV
jgi:YegS/Rv2252/BmrU family lipid kinase